MFARHFCFSVLSVDYSFGILDTRRSRKTDSIPIDWLKLDIRTLYPCEIVRSIRSSKKERWMFFFVGHEHHLWKPVEELKEKTDLILTQISDCLQMDHGRFIFISFQQPHFRRPFLAKSKYQWSIEVHSIPDGEEAMEYFVYVLTKGQTMNEEDQ